MAGTGVGPGRGVAVAKVVSVAEAIVAGGCVGTNFSVEVAGAGEAGIGVGPDGIVTVTGGVVVAGTRVARVWVDAA